MSPTVADRAPSESISRDFTIYECRCGPLVAYYNVRILIKKLRNVSLEMDMKNGHTISPLSQQRKMIFTYLLYHLIEFISEYHNTRCNPSVDP